MSRRSLLWFWIVIAATLLAAFSRFYHLASLPPQAWVDEAWYNLRARDLVQTGEFHVFYRTFWGGMHPLMVDLAAIVHALGIHSLVASRGVAAVSGILTIPLAFAAFDELWRREAWPASQRRLTAALTALILSNLLYLVVASRIGYGPALIPPVMLVYVWQTRRGQRARSWISWAVAGLALGLAQYINLNGRFLVPLVVMLALHDLWLSPKAQRRSVFLGLCLAAGVSLTVALPLIAFFVREPQWLLARAGHITVGSQQNGPGSLLNNAVRVALAFNFQGDFNPRQNLPGRPMFDWIQSVGLWAGLLWSVRKFRQFAAARELPAWTALMCLSSLITDDAPQFERMIGVGIPAAALVAIGWVEVWGWLSQRLRVEGRGKDGFKLKRAVTGLAVIFVAASLGLSTYDYFGLYPYAPGLAEFFTHTPVRLAHELIERARTEPVFVERITEAEDVYAFDFLFPGTPVRRLDFRQCLPLTDKRTTRTTYLVLSERDQDAAGNLIQALPSAKVTALKPEEAALMGPATLVEVAPGTPALTVSNAAHARFEPGLRLVGYDWSGPTLKAGQSLFLTLYWKAEAMVEADLTAFLHIGTGEGNTPVVAQRDGQPCQGLYPTSQWQVGDVVPDGFAVVVPPDTPPGDYPLVVGWYQYPSLDRLRLAEADTPLKDNRAVIGTITIAAP